MKQMLLLLILFLTGCSTFTSEQFSAEGAKASALCVKGGYAMAGGVVTGAKVNDDFKGTVIVAPDCGIALSSE